MQSVIQDQLWNARGRDSSKLRPEKTILKADSFLLPTGSQPGEESKVRLILGTPIFHCFSFFLFFPLEGKGENAGGEE